MIWGISKISILEIVYGILISVLMIGGLFLHSEDNDISRRIADMEELAFSPSYKYVEVREKLDGSIVLYWEVVSVLDEDNHLPLEGELELTPIYKDLSEGDPYPVDSFPKSGTEVILNGFPNKGDIKRFKIRIDAKELEPTELDVTIWRKLIKEQTY